MSRERGEEHQGGEARAGAFQVPLDCCLLVRAPVDFHAGRRGRGPRDVAQIVAAANSGRESIRSKMN